MDGSSSQTPLCFESMGSEGQKWVADSEMNSLVGRNAGSRYCSENAYLGTNLRNVLDSGPLLMFFLALAGGLCSWEDFFASDFCGSEVDVDVERRT